jgi:hypothetical protein
MYRSASIEERVLRTKWLDGSAVIDGHRGAVFEGDVRLTEVPSGDAGSLEGSVPTIPYKDQELERLWAHNLHEDNMFMQRGTSFSWLSPCCWSHTLPSSHLALGQKRIFSRRHVLSRALALL